jgi:large subunit ribosomal protein L30
MGNIKITQIKSVIDRSKRQKDTITALGIKKLHNPVVKEVNPQIMGMVAKVRHLITVEEC